LVERFKLFERNRVPRSLKVLGLAMYFQTSSLAGTARVLSEFYQGLKMAVWKWVVKLRKRLEVASAEEASEADSCREICVKVNGQHYWVYSALDIDRNELGLSHQHQTFRTRILVESASSSLKQTSKDILQQDNRKLEA